MNTQPKTALTAKQSLILKIIDLKRIYINSDVKPMAISLDIGEFDALVSLLDRLERLEAFVDRVEGKDSTKHSEERSEALSFEATMLQMPEHIRLQASAYHI